MEKIDIHNSKENYDKALIVLYKQLPKKNATLIENFLEASAIGKTQKKKKQAGLRVRIRNMYLLKTIAKFFKKPLDALTEKDMENLVKALNDNKIIPIWIGEYEANAITMELENISPPRPMTHDLINDILASLNSKV